MPTTVLHSNDISIQKATLKRWVKVAHVSNNYSNLSFVKKLINIFSSLQILFQQRDYSSASQICNGITDISISRLKYLKNVLKNIILPKPSDLLIYLNFNQSLSAKWQEKLSVICEAFDPRDGSQNYRSLNKDPPCIPFIGKYFLQVAFDVF